MDYTIARKDGSGAIAWTEEQVRYITEEYTIKDKTLKELAKEFSVQPQSIRNLLRRKQVKITNKKIRNYPRNSYYFHDIDSHEKAYWLGVMASDGAVVNGSVRLVLKDREHVKKFKKAVKAYNNKIVEIVDTRWEKICYTYLFAVRDEQLVKDLSKFGIVQNKTYIPFHLPSLREEFMYDFIRGYFDGDGCLCLNKPTGVLSFVGSELFLTELQHFLNKDNIKLLQNIKSKITYELKISGKADVKRILQGMYKNSTEETRLDRKYALAKSII